jgi:predicted transcriptional regulator
LYRLIDEGLEAVERGDVQPFDEAMADIRKEFGFA